MTAASAGATQQPMILVSACLLGTPVRYDGRAASCRDPRLQQWLDQGLIVSICPEVAGGLGVPRPAAEIRGGSGPDVLAGDARITTRDRSDVTRYFIAGAKRALELAQKTGARLAILKEQSPSCGSQQIHDGRFLGHRISGQGVTAALLRSHGIAVFNEHQLDDVARALRKQAPETEVPL